MKSSARLSLVLGLLVTSACAPPATTSETFSSPEPATAAAPDPDPRIGLRPGLFDAGEATWNLRVLSKTPPPKEFVRGINTDLAFTGDYAIQGSFSGFQVWDISNPRQPTLANGFVCPAAQSDVSVYQNLLFVSGEGPWGTPRLRHGRGQGTGQSRSAARNPHLRHKRHREPDLRRQRADLPWLTHALADGRP